MEKTINMTITPAWAVIEHVRKKIRNQLENTVKPDCVDATVICASELCENAIKYGESVPSMRFIQFKLTYRVTEINIVISNGIVNQVDIDNVCKTIDKINSAGNPEQLYLDRLKELLDFHRPQKSQLGLFRIACETGYGLGYEFENSALTITATLSI